MAENPRMCVWRDDVLSKSLEQRRPGPRVHGIAGITTQEGLKRLVRLHLAQPSGGGLPYHPKLRLVLEHALQDFRIDWPGVPAEFLHRHQPCQSRRPVLSLGTEHAFRDIDDQGFEQAPFRIDAKERRLGCKVKRPLLACLGNIYRNLLSFSFALEKEI